MLYYRFTYRIKTRRFLFFFKREQVEIIQPNLKDMGDYFLLPAATAQGTSFRFYKDNIENLSITGVGGFTSIRMYNDQNPNSKFKSVEIAGRKIDDCFRYMQFEADNGKIYTVSDIVLKWAPDPKGNIPAIRIYVNKEEYWYKENIVKWLDGTIGLLMRVIAIHPETNKRHIALVQNIDLERQCAVLFTDWKHAIFSESELKEVTIPIPYEFIDNDELYIKQKSL